MSMREFVLKLTVTVMLVFGVGQVLNGLSAQAQTPEPQVVAVTSQPGPAPVNITLNTPAAEPAALGGTNGVVLIVGALILVALGFGAAVITGKNPDTAATVRIQELEKDVQVIAEMRAAHDSADVHVQAAFGMVQTIVAAIAPFTPFKTDDEIAKLLALIGDPEVAKAALTTALVAKQADPPASV